jgi:DNA-binding CsgD family transcriptional regulator
MVCLSLKNISDIRQIAGDIHAAPTLDSLRRNIIQKVHRAFDSTSTIFWMIDDNRQLVNPVFEGIKEEFFTPYQTYFCHKNPFDPENMPMLSQPSVLMEQLHPLNDFVTSEYYNDFIRPQNIHRQMAVYIGDKNQPAAVIGMHRSAHKSFGKKGLFMGDMIAGFMSTALEHLKLRRQIEKQKGLHRMLEQSQGSGILLLDAKGGYLFSNPAARDILKKLYTQYPSDSESSVSPVKIPRFIIDTCITMNRSGLSFFKGIADCGSPDTVAVKWQQTGNTGDRNGEQGFVLFLEPQDDNLDSRSLRAQYRLTRREIEIIQCLTRGLTNKEIADHLFISRGTVKNHLKHIFAKTRAANRTQVVHIARSCARF